MSLLYLIKQYHRIRFSAHSLRQLTAFVISYVARRCTDQSAHAEFLLILAHIDTRHHRLVVEQVFSQGLGQFCLTYTRRTEEHERSDRTFRVLQSGTRTTHRITDSLNSLILSDNPLVQFFLQMQQFFTFALHHPCHRYTGPSAYHLSDIVGRHLFTYHGITVLRTSQLFVYMCYIVIKRFQSDVPFFGLLFQIFDLLFVLLYLIDQSTFALPFGAERLLLIFQFGYILIQLGYFWQVILPFDSLAFYFQLFQSTRNLIQFLRHRVAFHSQFGGSLVHQVDSLVRQETVRDIPLRQLHGSDTGIILNTHLMVVLVTFLQSTQDTDGTHFVRFIHHHGLETTFQRLVLFEILLVFVERRGTYRAQFTTSQSRFQNIRRIHSSFTAAGTHQRMYLIDEEDDVTVALCHLVDHALQSFLEFTFIFGTCEQSPHIQREQLLVFQVFRHIPPYDTFGEPFHDSRLTRTRFTY